VRKAGQLRCSEAVPHPGFGASTKKEVVKTAFCLILSLLANQLLILDTQMNISSILYSVNCTSCRVAFLTSNSAAADLHRESRNLIQGCICRDFELRAVRFKSIVHTLEQ